MRSTLIVLFALLAARPGLAEDAVKLAYKAAEPVEYNIVTTERSQRSGFVTTMPAILLDDDWHTYETRETVRQHVVAADGQLESRVQTLTKTMEVNGRPMKDHQFPTRSFSYRMDTRGTRSDAAKGDLATSLSPVFPAEAIAPGKKWEITIPPSEKFPHPFKVTHKLEKIETFQGEKCAYVTSEGSLVTKDKDLAFNVTVAGVTRIGLDSGVLLKATSMTVFNVQAIKKFKEGHKTLKRNVARTVERRVPGAAPGQ